MGAPVVNHWIDHLGVATESIERTARTFRGLFDAELVHEETMPDGLEIAFLALENATIELLQPTDSGTVRRFLDRSGAGIHHFGVGTPDIEASLTAAVTAGITPIDETPRPGAMGHEVAFLHPRDTGGVLVEFVQHSAS